MTDTSYAVYPSCGSPLLKELYIDDDVYETEIAFNDGDLTTPRLYHERWVRGHCDECVIGCAACGASFRLADAAASDSVDSHSVWEEVMRGAAGVDKGAFLARAPTHLASCECGNRRFFVEFSRTHLFAALYLADEQDDSEPQWRDRVITTPEFAFESIYCPKCDECLNIDQLVVDQIATPVHPDQLMIGLASASGGAADNSAAFAKTA